MPACDVVITGFRLNASEPAARVLQRLLALDEAEAKACARRFPYVARTKISEAEADHLAGLLQRAGAHVQVREHEPQGPAPEKPAKPAAAAEKSSAIDAQAPTLFDFPQGLSPFAADASNGAAFAGYKLGELEAPISKSQPAPALIHARAMNTNGVPSARSQPAPARSQPAPARSQPAPAPAASATAQQDVDPALNAAMQQGGLRMLDDTFEEMQPDQRPRLDIDDDVVGKGGYVSGGRKVGGELPKASEELGRRRRGGIVSVLMFPFILLQALWTSMPTALAFTGVAATTAGAVYFVRRQGKSHAGALTEDVEGAADQSAGEEAPPERGATHPLVRMAPKAMEPAVAAIIRSRFQGTHKVPIKWPEGTKPAGSVECLLVEQGHASKLRELTATGQVVDMPADVHAQLSEYMETLRAADSNPSAQYLSVCLAN